MVPGRRGRHRAAAPLPWGPAVKKEILINLVTSTSQASIPRCACQLAVCSHLRRSGVGAHQSFKSCGHPRISLRSSWAPAGPARGQPGATGVCQSSVKSQGQLWTTGGVTLAAELVCEGGIPAALSTQGLASRAIVTTLPGQPGVLGPRGRWDALAPHCCQTPSAGDPSPASPIPLASRVRTFYLEESVVMERAMLPSPAG